MLTKKVSGSVVRNEHKWGFLELFESTMNKDLHTGNPWLDPEAWRELQVRIKLRKKKVSFSLTHTIYVIPRSTEVTEEEEEEGGLNHQ